jgi:diaminopimelate epimerase
MLKYAKAHACGNDFLVIERSAALAAATPAEAERQLAIKLCARTTGVGADGVEFLTWTGERSGTIHLRNADGSVAEISGNGTRCVAAWMAFSKQAQPGEQFTLATDAGERTCVLEAHEGTRMQLRSSMGVPAVEQASITLDEEGVLVDGAIVSTGNTHFVLRVESADFSAYGMDWQTLGRALCFHPQFPAQTNVEFLRILSPSAIEIRIFERGVGPTTSSGTGTCATAAAAMHLHGCQRMLQVHAPGGTQTVSWPSDLEEMELTGPAELIATGTAFLTGPAPEALA